MTPNPIFCAIDRSDPQEAAALIAALGGQVGGIKLGLEFFVANGADGVRQVMRGSDLPLFLDLKFHDIPNTVAGALQGVIALAPAFTTIHASGGRAMIESAVRSANGRSKILAVTLLTSLAQPDLPPLGIAGTPADQVLRLAELALAAGADGLVCSPQEVALLRAEFGSAPTLMVPGIRPDQPDPAAPADDQARTLTPRQAMAAGANFLVIGRPITAHADPARAAQAIIAGLERV